MISLIYQYISHFVALWLRADQYGYAPHPTRRNNYFIKYEFEGKPYRLLITKKKGPPTVVSIHGLRTGDADGEMTDVYDEIRMYMGPNADFHNVQYSCACLGFQRLVFGMSDDKEHEFTGNDIIRLGI